MNYLKSKKELVLLIALISIFINAEQSFASSEPDSKLAKAKALIDKGQPKAAVTILRPFIKNFPQNAEAHMLLGAALASLAENDNYDEALEQEKLAIKLDPKSSGAHRILGMIYANQRKIDPALDSLKEACKLNPTSFAAQRDLAAALETAGKPDEAKAALEKAISLKPDNLGAHMRLASLFYKQSHLKEAAAEARVAVKLAASKAETHLLLANILLEAQDQAGATESYKEAIAANGYDALGCKNPLTAATAFSGLGAAMVLDKSASKETLAKALAYQKKSMKAYEKYLPAYLRSAEILARLKRTKEAESIYKNIFKATKQDELTGLSYARFLKAEGRAADAREVLKQVLEKTPQSKEAKSALAGLESASSK